MHKQTESYSWLSEMGYEFIKAIIPAVVGHYMGDGSMLKTAVVGAGAEAGTSVAMDRCKPYIMSIIDPVLSKVPKEMMMEALPNTAIVSAAAEQCVSFVRS